MAVDCWDISDAAASPSCDDVTDRWSGRGGTDKCCGKGGSIGSGDDAGGSVGDDGDGRSCCVHGCGDDGGWEGACVGVGCAWTAAGVCSVLVDG